VQPFRRARHVPLREHGVQHQHQIQINRLNTHEG
jgi:hypothetical protein